MAIATAAPARAAESWTVERAGARLYVEAAGSGEPVLLRHGGVGHMGWFADLRAHLVASGHRVILVDKRGIGRSNLGSQALSYRVQEEDACAVIGYRMAVAANPRVTRLVTIGSRWSAENGRGL